MLNKYYDYMIERRKKSKTRRRRADAFAAALINAQGDEVLEKVGLETDENGYVYNKKTFDESEYGQKDIENDAAELNNEESSRIAQDKHGENVIFPIHIKKRMSRLMVNRIASIYGKKSTTQYAVNQISEGNLIDADVKRSFQCITRAGIQLPSLVQSNLKTSKDVVSLIEQAAKIQTNSTQDSDGDTFTGKQVKYSQKVNSEGKTLADEQKIFEKYRLEEGGTALQESGLPDWTDGPGLIDWLQDNGYDYDGLILDEGGYFGEKGKLINRGLSYVPFSEETQIKSTDNENPTSDPDIRYSKKVNEFELESYSNREIKNWSNSKKITIANSEEDIIKFLNSELHTGKNKMLMCGKISKKHAQRIMRDTGVDLFGYNVCITSSFENSHNDSEKETSRGQATISFDIVAKFPFMVAEYDTVAVSPRTSRDGRKVLEFTKDIDGKKVAIAQVTVGNMSLQLQTMYGWSNKKSTVVRARDALNANPITSETDTNSGTRDMISQLDANVKKTDIHYSKKVDEAVYDAVGESERLKAENDKLKADLASTLKKV